MGVTNVAAPELSQLRVSEVRPHVLPSARDALGRGGYSCMSARANCEGIGNYDTRTVGGSAASPVRCAGHGCDGMRPARVAIGITKMW